MPNVAKNTVAYANKKMYIQKFNKENYVNVSIFVNKTKEKDILDKLQSQPQKSVYIKQLIRKDIEKPE